MPQITVSYTDLDISRPAGAQILLQRLGAAANNVCGGQPDMRNLGMQGYFRSCFSQAMNGAVAAVHSPLVAELYANRKLAQRDTAEQNRRKRERPVAEPRRTFADHHAHESRNRRRKASAAFASSVASEPTETNEQPSDR